LTLHRLPSWSCQARAGHAPADLQSSLPTMWSRRCQAT
jgi:hypothetical protein